MVRNVRVRLACVAPLIAPPFFFHWNVGAGTPAALTVKVADPPAAAVWFALGWARIVGAVFAGGGGGGAEGSVTVSTAGLLETEPAILVATAR